MGFFKKITKPFKKIVDTAIDFVTDTAKSAINIITSAFTGGFNVPDVDVGGADAINNELQIDYNSSNSPIPVLYGRKVETVPIPIFIKTHGDKNQYLTMVGAIATGMTQTDAVGGMIFNITIDGEMLGPGFDTSSTPGDYSFVGTNHPIGNYGDGTSNYAADRLERIRTFYNNPIVVGGKGGQQSQIWTPEFGRYVLRLKCQFFNGSDDQPISSLAATAGFNKRLPGIMYGVWQFHLRSDDTKDRKGVIYKNPYNGLPQITLITDGRNVPDIVSRPQTHSQEAVDRWDTVFASGTYDHLGGHNDYGTAALGSSAGGCYAPTHNPVHHLLDYMLNPFYGMGLPLSKFDKESWVSASQVCRRFRNNAEGSMNLYNILFSLKGLTGLNDMLNFQTDSIFTSERKLMQPTATDGVDYSDNNYYDRIPWTYTPYARQFRIYPDRTYLENINLMLTSMGAVMVYSNGKFKIIMENAGNLKNSFDIPDTAALKAQCDADNRTFTDETIVDSVAINGQSLDSTFNQVKVNFPDLEKESKSNSVVYPDKGSTLYQSLLIEDNNQELTAEVTNLGIFHYEMALIYAKILLNKSRNKETISFVTTQAASNIVPGDIIRVNSSLANVDSLYRVTEILLTESGQIEISGYRHISIDYDFEKDDLVDIIKNIIRNREAVIGPSSTRLKPVEGLLISKVAKPTDTDLFSTSMDIVVKWIDRNTLPSNNQYEVKLENVTQNNTSFSPRVLAQVSGTEYKFSSNEMPDGATFTISVTLIGPNGERTDKSFVEGNNIYIFGSKVAYTKFPFDKLAFDNTLANGGAILVDTQRGTVATQQGEL